MRILFKEGRSLLIREIDEVKISKDNSAIIIPKQRKKYITGEKSEELFYKILSEGYADFSVFDSERHVSEVLL